ncbi:MAG: hypothetical protein WBL42_08350 [Methanoregula sp.]
MGGSLENMNSSESIYLSNSDDTHSGTFSVDTSDSTNGSVFFGSPEQIVRGNYVWESNDTIILTTDDGNRYAFLMADSQYYIFTLNSGFENSTQTVNQFKYSWVGRKC